MQVSRNFISSVSFVLIVIFNAFTLELFSKTSVSNYDSIVIYQKLKQSYFCNDPIKAIDYVNRLLVLSKKEHANDVTVQCWLDLYYLHAMAGNNQKSLPYAQLTCKGAALLQNNLLLAQGYRGKSEYYKSQALPDSALKYDLQCLNLCEMLSDSKEVAKSMLNLAVDYSILGNFDRTLNCYEQATKYSQTDSDILGFISLAKANYYNELNLLADAEKNYLEAIQRYRTLGNISKLNDARSGLAVVYMRQKDRGIKARDLLKDVIYAYTKMNDWQGACIANENLASVYADCFNDKKSALSNYLKAEVFALKSGNKDHLASVYKNLSKTYQEIGSYKLSLRYEQKSNNISSEVLNDENLKYVSGLQELYEKEKKENRIKILTKENALSIIKVTLSNKQKQLWLISAIGLFTALCILFFIYRMRERNAKVLSAKKEQIFQEQISVMMKEHELKSINTMMEAQEHERKRIAEDLHDRLGSMLATVKLHFSAVERKIENISSENIDQYRKANQLLDEVFDEVRRIAYNVESGSLVNFGLIHALTDLCDAIQSSSRLEININSFGMNDRLGNELEICIYRIIQELLSNIIKHAKATEVHIDIQKSKKNITLIIQDNGKGYDSAAPDFKHGLGLRNIHSRITKIKGNLHIDSGSNGTSNIIEIPI